MSSTLPRLDGPADAELISAVRGGDIDAYGDLFERHVEAARRLARQLVSSSDADDLVSVAFTKVLTVLQRGGGPDVAFRAYLLTAVRRLHVDQIRSGSRVQATDEIETFDVGVPFRDTAVEGFENAAAARAFASLPERWQLVLWHTEVEGSKPADIAPLLGMSPNSVAALAYRAREGLRQAFLTAHAGDIDSDTCVFAHANLGSYVRKGTSGRDSARIEKHLDECRKCMALYLELTEVNTNLGAVLAPLVLGGAAAAYLGGSGAATGAGVLALVFSRARDFVIGQGSVAAASTVVAAVAVGAATSAYVAFGPGSLDIVSSADVRPGPVAGSSDSGDQFGDSDGVRAGAGSNGDSGSGASGEGDANPDAGPGATAPGGDPTTGSPGPTAFSPPLIPEPPFTPSAPPTSAPAPTSTAGPTSGPTSGPTPTPTSGPTPAPTPTQPTPTPTKKPKPTKEPEPTKTPSPSAKPTPTSTPTPTPTPTKKPKPTKEPEPTKTPSPSSKPTPTSTLTPTPEPTPTPTPEPEPTPTLTPEPTPTPTPTPEPEPEPEPELPPTPTPTLPVFDAAVVASSQRFVAVYRVTANMTGLNPAGSTRLGVQTQGLTAVLIRDNRCSRAGAGFDCRLQGAPTAQVTLWAVPAQRSGVVTFQVIPDDTSTDPNAENNRFVVNLTNPINVRAPQTPVVGLPSAREAE